MSFFWGHDGVAVRAASRSVPVRPEAAVPAYAGAACLWSSRDIRRKTRAMVLFMRGFYSAACRMRPSTRSPRVRQYQSTNWLTPPSCNSL